MRASHGGKASIGCTCGSWELCWGADLQGAPLHVTSLSTRHQPQHQHRHQPRHQVPALSLASAKIYVVVHDIRHMCISPLCACHASHLSTQGQRCPTLELATSAQVRTAQHWQAQRLRAQRSWAQPFAGSAFVGSAFVGSAFAGSAFADPAFADSACFGYDLPSHTNHILLSLPAASLTRSVLLREDDEDEEVCARRLT